MIKGSEMEQITKEDWKRKPKDYKTIIDGQRYILKGTNNGPCLVPVEIIKEGKEPQKKTNTKLLTCFCCGSETRGRQWYNRDLGFGCCSNCVEFLGKKESAEELRSMIGIEGDNYNIKE